MATGEDLALFSVDEFSTEMVSCCPAVFHPSIKAFQEAYTAATVSVKDNVSFTYRALKVSC